MPFDGRGKYERPHCPVHGKGHRFGKFLGVFNARTTDNRVRTVRARVCKCGVVRMDVDVIITRESYERWNDIPFNELPEQITFPVIEKKEDCSTCKWEDNIKKHISPCTLCKQNPTGRSMSGIRTFWEAR